MFWAKNSYFLAKFGATPPPPFAGGKLHNNFCGIGGYPRPPPLYGKKLQISIWKVPNSWKELLMMCQKVFATPLGWGMGGVGGQLGRRGIAKYKYIYNHNDTEYMNWKDCFYLMFDLPRIIYFAIFQIFVRSFHIFWKKKMGEMRLSKNTYFSNIEIISMSYYFTHWANLN